MQNIDIEFIRPVHPKLLKLDLRYIFPAELPAMACRRPGRASQLLLPFLYPHHRRLYSSASAAPAATPDGHHELPESRLNPRPDDYAASRFADKAELTLQAGRGGHGCVSFLREAYMPDGPPDGGDGGNGGSVYIQAAPGETSLYKLARSRFIRAGRGRNGQGGRRGGARGEDVVITVPVGTIVRELERTDPVADEAAARRAHLALLKARKRRGRKRAAERKLAKLGDGQSELEDGSALATLSPPLPSSSSTRNVPDDEAAGEEEAAEDEFDQFDRQKWLLHPSIPKAESRSATPPRLPRRPRYLIQPAAPIHLDLTEASARPILLAVGGTGGLGNPHFNSREHPRPLFATRGDDAVSLKIALELKLLADVGLVGLPNAGKSTLLRALTNSRARVGSWAFTTLQPNVGTVVLDNNAGRPLAAARRGPSSLHGHAAALPFDDPKTRSSRSRFTIADIPGLIEGAHLDRGLGIAFLRHVERAAMLAFVIDLSAGDAVRALVSLWREVALYAQMRQQEEDEREAAARVDAALETTDDDADDFGSDDNDVDALSLAHALALDATAPAPPAPPLRRIAGKPWFVVATKAELPGTQENFAALKRHLADVSAGSEPHPSGLEGAWVEECVAIPVSAIHGQGVDRIVHWTVDLLGK